LPTTPSRSHPGVADGSRDRLIDRMHLPWVQLVIASCALLVLRQLLEQRIDVLEGHQWASGGRKSRESRSSPDTNQSLDVARWLQMDRSVSRMPSNSLVC